MNFDGGGRVVGASGDAFGLKLADGHDEPKRGRERQVWPTRGSKCGPEKQGHQAMVTPPYRM